MQKLTALLLIALLLTGTTYAQSALVHGKVTDSIEKKNLSNSPVLLLRKSDSIMVRFTRTDKGGNFLLKNIPPGQFLIMVSYPSYADFVDEVNVRDSLPVTLPPIGLILKSKLLEEVVVSGNKGAIRIKGDTVEFRADSFHTQAGATVEDLLKKLPGIQVDKNGKITAQGEAIKKVLVDGEEFFGDDPTLVTQNLRADMIDKVQVYDKKSDQAAFTGIDDGEKTKTINLKLKDSKKNGYFGRASGGGATDGYYDAQVMLNAFRKKQKLALYGIVSNTGKTGLNWQERDNYGQSNAGNAEYDESMGYYTINGQNDELEGWDGRYNGQGLPAVRTGGVHYNTKWNDDHQSINGNYKFLQLNIKDSSNANSEYILPDTLYYNRQTSVSNNQIVRNRGNVSYEMQFDSSFSMKLSADGGNDHKTTDTRYATEARAIDSSLVNEGTRSVSTSGDNSMFNANLLLRKKLAKKGRTLSFNIKENYTHGTTDGHLYSSNFFYSKGGPADNQIYDQLKNYHSQTSVLDTKLTYTEPLSASSSLIANYGIVVDNASSDRNSFNRSAGGKYDVLDSLYSNDYRFNIFTDRGGLSYSLVKKKLRFNAGSNIGITSFNQTDVHADTSSRRNFVNWYPQANLSYAFTNQRRLGFRYNGSTVQPTIQQIQPTLTNEDPLNITVGNPGLKPQFRNEASLNFFDYKVLTERYIWASISYNATQNSISNRVTVDSTGKRISQAINVNGNYSFNGWLNYYFKWKGPGLNIGLNGNLNEDRNISVVNDVQNITNSGRYTMGFNIGKSKEKKYELGLNASATYTQSVSSVNTGITTSYWTGSANPYMDIFLPLKFQIHGDADISIRQKTSVFDNNTDVTLLNAWIGKKFLKNDVLLVKVSGNDLLNQNIGFNRTVNSNFISQNTYLSIKRYFMFSIVWNFTKAGTAAPAGR
ncbi:MAG TPA: outer membrane beta-barrel protein [Puia sp.]|nr:outer membrane beta-barrel protein [Puia sp.]